MLWTICKKLGICILTFCCTFCLDYCITVTKVFIKVSRNAIFLYCNLDKLWICREQQNMSKTKIFKTWRFKGFLLPKLRTSQERISQNYLQNLTRYNWSDVLKHLQKNFSELSCLKVKQPPALTQYHSALSLDNLAHTPLIIIRLE